VWGRAQAAAVKTLERNIEVFEGEGYRRTARNGALEARLERPGGRPLRLRMARAGRVFGGSYALEVAPAEPVLPATRGLAARGRGVVRLSRVAFRPRGRDSEGRRLARRLDEDAALQRALADVHFELVRVDPDGRPVIRHMGGSVVWVLFPPLVRPVPLVPEQARATARALETFAELTE
jgi:hypothetical protein